MSPCPVCGQAVDPLRSRAVAVRMGKVTAYCSNDCLAKAGGSDSGPVIEIASKAPAKRDDTIGASAIGDDTAIRKYSTQSTAEREALPVAKKSRATLVMILVLLAVGGFAVYYVALR